MKIREKELDLPLSSPTANLIEHFKDALSQRLESTSTPVRFAITKTTQDRYSCEVGVFENEEDDSSGIPSIFDYELRPIENTNEFNAVLLVPTGIGAAIGGHAGDATPVARLLASICDNLITHPNVVNASDINEMSDNTLYVEGSVITRLMMGTAGLSLVRSNRVLVVIEKHPTDDLFTNAAINAVNAARATQGLTVADIVILESGLSLKGQYTSSGSAVGQVDNMNPLCQVLERYKGSYDAVAIISIIDVPRSFHAEYFKTDGEMVNPWGGAEAIFTHTLSSLYDVPMAHSPMLEDQLIANFDPGVVDPRKAAEAISLTFLPCIFKGLQRAPKIVTDKETMQHHGVFTAADISCLVIPDNILGLPVLAALYQGIKVIAVRENKNLMQNDLTHLPWAEGQFHQVDNYLEASGVMSAMKEGLAVSSLRRPMINSRSSGQECDISEDIRVARTK